jgi:two-component system sensor histidine kinase KdpD
MLPFRSSLSFAAAALVFVLPVVGAMLVGGTRVGLLGIVLGFVVLDLAFIPPYWTLAVGSGQNWLALVVYVAVVLLVATVVSRLQQLRTDAARRAADSRRLLELSELLVADKPVREMLAVVASSVRSAFNLETVALLLPSAATGYLEIVASDGPELGDESLDRLLPAPGTPASLTGSVVAGALLRQIPLTATGRPVGLLVLRGRALDVHDRGLIATYANHAALAIERAQLRDQALQANLLQRVDEWRAALVSSVAHDLRTPLASIKVAVSDLREPAIVLPDAARRDLLETIEEQTDRLTRLVSTVLDLWRLEAGALKPNREPLVVDDLIDEAAALVERSFDTSRLRRVVAADLPHSRWTRHSSLKHWQTCWKTPPGTALPTPRSWWRRRAGEDRRTRSRSRSPIRAQGSRLSNASGSSSCSTVEPMAGGPDSGWRSRRRSSKPMVAASESERPGEGARASC